MKNVEVTCPGCHKHCSLTSPRCRIGKKYARTGIPQEGKTPRQYSDRSEAEAAGELRTAIPEITQFSDEQLTKSLRFVSHALRHEKGTLAPLSEGEKTQLDALLAKLRDGWRTEEAGMPGAHHGHKKHGKRQGRDAH